MLSRIVIIGNSGSGKSYLAKSLSAIYSVPVVHLDQIFWMPGGFNEKRPNDEIKSEIEQRQKDDSWIAEGVFGELATFFLARTQSLIFLDMDWSACHKGLISGGSESSRQLSAVKAEENFSKLLLWAEQYWIRTNLCSQSGHLQMFANFAGHKFRFTSQAEVNEFLNQQRQS
ncbi:MAG TPA: AAA family ATPase [Verrucomicrobiae bacterium]